MTHYYFNEHSEKLSLYKVEFIETINIDTTKCKVLENLAPHKGSFSVGQVINVVTSSVYTKKWFYYIIHLSNRKYIRYILNSIFHNVGKG